MRVGIALDRWKLSIFKKHLDNAGFKYSSGPGISDDTMFLYVITDELPRIQQVVQNANDEAAQTKQNSDLAN